MDAPIQISPALSGLLAVGELEMVFKFIVHRWCVQGAYVISALGRISSSVYYLYVMDFSVYSKHPKAFEVQREPHAEETGHPWERWSSWGEWGVCGMWLPGLL